MIKYPPLFTSDGSGPIRTDVSSDPKLVDQPHALMNLGIKSERMEVPDQIEEQMETRPGHGSGLSYPSAKSSGDEHQPQLCRLCANPGDGLINMSGNSGLYKYFLEKIEFCLPAIEMRKTDNLTKKACQLCSAQLELCYQFLKMAAKADKKLRAFEEQKSAERRQRDERIQTPPPSRVQYDTVTRANVKEQFDITPTFFADELPIKDAPVRSDLISRNLNDSVEQGGGTNSSSNKHQEINLATNTSKPSTSATQADQGTSRSSQNHSAHSDEELEFDVSDSESDAPPAMQSVQALTIPKKESMESNNNEDPTSCNEEGEENDQNKLDTEDIKIEEEITVLDDYNEFEKKFLVEPELVEHELSSYESLGEPSERPDSVEIIDVERTSENNEASSGSGLALAENNEFACEHCEMTFMSKSVLIDHVRKHTGGRLYSCEVCGASFPYEPDRDRHRISHTMKRVYNCDYCAKRFVDADSRDAHSRIHTGDRPYNCYFCSKTFARASNRNVHLRIHTGERPFKCSICNMSFHAQCAIDSHLMRHLKTNSNQVTDSPGSSVPGKYRCAYCGSTSKSKADLAIHIRTHTGERPYSCDFCGKTFARVHTRNTHRRIHTGERPYRCDFCPKTFARISNRNIHHATHKNERPFACPICKKPFKAARTRDLHVFKHSLRQ